MEEEINALIELAEIPEDQITDAVRKVARTGVEYSDQVQRENDKVKSDMDRLLQNINSANRRSDCFAAKVEVLEGIIDRTIRRDDW